jgi:hypothetical protein
MRLQVNVMSGAEASIKNVDSIRSGFQKEDRETMLLASKRDRDPRRPTANYADVPSCK